MTINSQYHVLTKVLSLDDGKVITSEFINHSHLGLRALQIACASLTSKFLYSTNEKNSLFCAMKLLHINFVELLLTKMAFQTLTQNKYYILVFLSVRSNKKGYVMNEKHLTILSCTVDDNTVKIFFINANGTVILLKSSDLQHWTTEKLTNVLFNYSCEILANGF